MTHIASSLPGRLRIRWQALSSADCAQRLSQSLRELPGFKSAEHKIDARSLIVFYDPAKLPVETLEAALDAFCDAEQATRRKTRHRVLRASQQANRFAKIGMLGSLAVSLALIAARQKKSHALWGVVFLLFLAIHLVHYRRLIFR
jgi:cation transport ATPase